MGTKTFSELRTEVARLGHWNISSTGTASYLAATAAAESGLREIDKLILRGCNFPWAEVQTTLALSTLTDGYKLSVPARLLRVQGTSWWYSGTQRQGLEWRSLEYMDAALNPGWRTAAGTTGTPSMITRVASQFWVGVKPSTEFISSYPDLYYGYYQRESSADSTLLIDDVYFDCVVHAALMVGLKQKDDSDQAMYRQLWQQVDVPLLQSASYVSRDNERLEGGPLSVDSYAAIDDDY